MSNEGDKKRKMESFDDGHHRPRREIDLRDQLDGLRRLREADRVHFLARLEEDRLSFQSQIDALSQRMTQFQSPSRHTNSLPLQPENDEKDASDDSEIICLHRPGTKPRVHGDQPKTMTTKANNDEHGDLYNATPEPRESVLPNRPSPNPSVPTIRNSYTSIEGREEGSITVLPRSESGSHIEEVKQYVRDLEQKAVVWRCGMQVPLLIRILKPLENLQIANQPQEEFSFDIIKKFLGGSFGDGQYWARGEEKRKSSLFPQIKSYLMLNREDHPLLPRTAGDHGARLLPCVLSLDDDSEDDSPDIWPLFIRHGQKGNFKYFGSYKQPSSAERLSRDEMTTISKQAKQSWAQMLGTGPRNRSKQDWKLETLKKMWPRKPTAYRWNENTETVVLDMCTLVSDPDDVYLMRRPITTAEAEAIKPDMIMKAFDATEGDKSGVPAVRLFHGYLECIGYDLDLYNSLRTNVNTSEPTKARARG